MTSRSCSCIRCGSSSRSREDQRVRMTMDPHPSDSSNCEGANAERCVAARRTQDPPRNTASFDTHHCQRLERGRQTNLTNGNYRLHRLDVDELRLVPDAAHDQLLRMRRSLQSELPMCVDTTKAFSGDRVRRAGAHRGGR